MKRKILVVVSLFLMLVTPVNAEAPTYNDYPVVNVTVNGKAVTGDVPAIIMDGRTLLPVRAISESIGASVAWNPNTQTVEITAADAVILQAQLTAANDQVARLGKKANALASRLEQAGLSAAYPLPTPGSPLPGSHRNPLPIGMSGMVVAGTSDQKFTARVAVLQTVRGDAAWKMVRQANMFNDAPKEGQEYLLTRIRFELVAISPEGSALALAGSWLRAISGAGKEYDNVFAVEPEPALDAKLYRGASTEGWASYLVDKTDAAPVLVLARDSLGRGGVWFATKND